MDNLGLLIQRFDRFMDLGALNGGGGRLAVSAGGTQPRVASHAVVGSGWLGAPNFEPSPLNGVLFIQLLSSRIRVPSVVSPHRS